MIYDDYFQGCNITSESISDIGYEYTNIDNHNLFKLIETNGCIILSILKDNRFSSGFHISIKNKSIYVRVSHNMRYPEMPIPISDEYRKYMNRIVLKIKGIIDKSE